MFVLLVTKFTMSCTVDYTKIALGWKFATERDLECNMVVMTRQHDELHSHLKCVHSSVNEGSCKMLQTIPVYERNTFYWIAAACVASLICVIWSIVIGCTNGKCTCAVENAPVLLLAVLDAVANWSAVKEFFENSTR